MQSFIVAGNDKGKEEEAINKLLSPFSISPFDITRVTYQKEAQNTIGIAQIKELIRNILLMPFKGLWKAVIIENAHSLTIEAQNALLKTLEEPPDNTIIILITTKAEALLPTILSRCRIIELRITNYELRKDELSTLNSQPSTLLEQGMGEKLVLAQIYGKDRETAIAWLAKMILLSRQLLINKVTKEKNHTEDIPVYLQHIKLFQKAHTLLTTTNVNPRFTLETLFLSL